MNIFLLCLPIMIISLPFVIIGLCALYQKILFELDYRFEGILCSEEKHILALKHFLENESDWLIKKELLRFPKEGNMAKVSFSKHADGSWEFSDTSEYTDFIKGGYVKTILDKEHKRSYGSLQYERIANTLYPDGMPVLLMDGSKPKHKKEKVNIYY